MKLPYRVGDSCALPLGDGTDVCAQIVACGRHTVDLSVRSDDGVLLPTLRASDRALVLHRWRRVAREAPYGAAAAEQPYWTGPAKIERTVATMLGRGVLGVAPLHVSRGRPTASYAVAANASDLRGLSDMQHALTVVAPLDLAEVARACPHLRHLRIAVAGWRFDARAISGFTALRALECSGAIPERMDELKAPAWLRYLRVARVAAFDVATLRSIPATALAFEAIGDLHHTEALFERAELEQLELLDAWKLDLDEVMPFTALPRLLRARIDAGGRRKNVELYRRARWAYPWPVELYATQ